MPDSDGNPAPHYGPFSLTVTTDDDSVSFVDVFFGDVYICAGDQTLSLPNVGASGEEFGDIRRFQVDPKTSPEPSNDLNGEWLNNGDSLSSFSNTCFEAAKKLRMLDPAGEGEGGQTNGLTMPIGIIQATASDSLIADWGFGGEIFNAMISPLLQIAVRGVFFSQGVADFVAGTSEEAYATTFSEYVVEGWRNKGQIGDYSFAFTQYGAELGGGAASDNIRYAQITALPRPFDDATKSTQPICTTALTPTYDVSDGSIASSRIIASRLALSMAHLSYAKQEPTWGWTAPVLVAATKSVLTFASGQKLKLSCAEGEGGQAVEGSVDGETWVPSGSVQVVASNTLEVVFELELVKFVRVGGSENCFILNQNGVVSPAKMVAVINNNNNNNNNNNFNTSNQQLKPFERTGNNSTYSPPPMGFNTWNRWHCWVSESLLKKTVDLMESLGLIKAGYTFLNIDDCWQAARNPDGTIYVDETRFPGGLRKLGDYAHDKGMSYGLYTSQSGLTCQSRPGSYDREILDAQTYCDADADYLKVDHCGGDQYQAQNYSWITFRTELDNCAKKRGRKFWLACSSCQPVSCLRDGSCEGVQGCGEYVAQAGCDIWRTTTDIQARWDSIMENLDLNSLMAPVQKANPGHYNDPDMLQVGNVGLTIVEQKTHFALWALMGGPLLISTELSLLSEESLAILTNEGLIRMNQDTLVEQGVRVGASGEGGEIWAKRMEGGTMGVVVFNRLGAGAAVPPPGGAGAAMDIVLEFDVLPIAENSGGWDITDVWAGEDIGTYSSSYTASKVPLHGHMGLILTPT